MTSKFGLTRQQLIVLIVLGVLDLAVVVGLFLVMFSSYRASRPALMPTATATPAPTNTRIVHATWTPKPGAKATRTSLEVRKYADEVSPILDNIRAAWVDVGDMMSLAGDYPELILDEYWIVGMSAQFALLQDYADDARAVSAPSEMRECHSHLLQMVSYSDRAVDLLIQGIDERDSERITSADRAINMIGEKNDDFLQCIIPFLD